VFRREVARLDDAETKPGRVPGHRARHILDGREAAFTDPFLVLAEDWMPRGAFPIHPHRGIETVTLVLEGVIGHRDSAGHSGLIEAGDAQWMTAGRGVRHEEDPPEGAFAHTLQLWVNLPASDKMAPPRYQDLRRDAMPVRREPGVEARVFSGRSGDVVAPTLNHVPVTLVEARIEPGAALRQTLPADDNAFVYVISGEADVGDARTPVGADRLAWLTRSEGEGLSEVTVSAAGKPARLLIVSGRPLREPIAMGGPFVMNTEAEIAQAFADFRAGKF
jgi:redox-sensitive bicupin YhaK (pirin superfamily)